MSQSKHLKWLLAKEQKKIIYPIIISSSSRSKLFNKKPIVCFLHSCFPVNFLKKILSSFFAKHIWVTWVFLYFISSFSIFHQFFNVPFLLKAIILRYSPTCHPTYTSRSVFSALSKIWKPIETILSGKIGIFIFCRAVFFKILESKYLSAPFYFYSNIKYCKHCWRRIFTIYCVKKAKM